MDVFVIMTREQFSFQRRRRHLPGTAYALQLLPEPTQHTWYSTGFLIRCYMSHILEIAWSNKPSALSVQTF